MEVANINFDEVKQGDFQVVDPLAMPSGQQSTDGDGQGQAPAGDGTPPAGQAPDAPPAGQAPATPAPAGQDAPPAGQTPPATPPTSQPAAQAAPTDWKDTLKQFGFNDDFIKLAEFAKTKGDLTEYLKVKSANFKEMDPISLVRMEFDEKYSTLSAEEREVLWDVEVVEKYNLDRDRFPETDRAAQAGMIKLKLEADRIRQDKIKYQESFGAPSYEDPAVNTVNQVLDSIKSSQEMSALLQSKTLPFQVEGKPVFNLRVEDPDELGNMFIDPDKFGAHAFDENDKPRVQRMLMAAAILKEGDLVVKKIFEAGVAAGRNNQYEVTEDAQQFGGGAAPSAPEESIFEAFRNRGRLVEPNN
jgi:hypothetical protein